MKVMVMVKATRDSENGVPPTAEALEAMVRYNEELVKAGVLLAAEGLTPSREGKRVHFALGSPTITDGPFPETKEIIAGFSIWEVGSMEEAIAWIKRFPQPMPADAQIELRPVFHWRFEEPGEEPGVKVQEKERELWRQNSSGK
jgi:hypothetical protein